jgi:hypothetical protein
MRREKLELAAVVTLIVLLALAAVVQATSEPVLHWPHW